LDPITRRLGYPEIGLGIHPGSQIFRLDSLAPLAQGQLEQMHPINANGVSGPLS
jgi:hypothetical protein